MMRVEPGDELEVKPLFNRTEREPNQLPAPCVVETVTRSSGCQSGILFGVRTKSGKLRQLDAAWFTRSRR